MKNTSEQTAGSRASLAAGSRSKLVDEHDGIDLLLVGQLSDRTRYDAWTGEMRLALAVVEDAIHTVRTTSGVATARARRLGAEAWTWLAARDTSHPFAFENLCDYLGLNAGWLRNGLRLAGYGESLTAPPSPRRRHERRLRVAVGERT